MYQLFFLIAALGFVASLYCVLYLVTRKKKKVTYSAVIDYELSKNIDKMIKRWN